jgi:hypothetical protein
MDAASVTEGEQNGPMCSIHFVTRREAGSRWPLPNRLKFDNYSLFVLVIITPFSSFLLLFDVVLTSSPTTGKVSPHNKDERVLKRHTGELNRQRPVSLVNRFKNGTEKK